MPRPRTILVLTRHTPLPWEDGAGAYLFDILRHLRTKGFTVHIGWLAPHEHLRWQGLWTLPADFAAAATLHTPGGWRFGRRQFYPSIYWLPFKARALHAIKQALGLVGVRVSRRPRSPSPVHRSQPTAHRHPAGAYRHHPTAARPSPTAHRPLPPSLTASGISLPSTGWMSAPSAAEHAFAAGLIERLRPSAVIVNYAWITPLFDSGAGPDSDFLRVCLHPDVAWKRAALQCGLDGLPPLIDRATEAALLVKAEVVVGITEADAAELRLLAPAASHLVAPKAVSARPLPAADSRRLLFVGSGNSFNIAGLSWFLAEVWPLVRAAQPDAVLDVCGTVAAAIKNRPAGAHFHGPVPNLDTYYSTAAVVVVPLLHATGLNIKLVDAAAHCRAIVTTAATLEGAPFLTGAVAAADSPAAFAGAIIGLLADPAARAALAERSLAAVRERLAPEACYASLAAALA
jgi:succinoglycan biosynthesis protein ExoO